MSDSRHTGFLGGQKIAAVHRACPGNDKYSKRQQFQQGCCIDQSRCTGDAAHVDQCDPPERSHDDQEMHGGLQRLRHRTCYHIGKGRSNAAASEEITNPKQRAGDIPSQRPECGFHVAVSAAAARYAATTFGETDGN
jgi:hypothetical protein